MKILNFIVLSKYPNIDSLTRFKRVQITNKYKYKIHMYNNSNKNAAIFYMDIPHTTKEEKFAILSRGFEETKFELLSETSKDFFIKIDTTYLDRFEQFIPINSIFKSNPVSGIMIGRDRLLVDVDENILCSEVDLDIDDDHCRNCDNFKACFLREVKKYT